MSLTMSFCYKFLGDDHMLHIGAKEIERSKVLVNLALDESYIAHLLHPDPAALG